MKNKKGFTLVELLAVIVILGVIMIIAIPSVLNTLESSRKSTFSLYAKKVVVAAEKTNYQEELQQKITGKGIYTYDIKEDLDFNSTGNYEGYVVIDNCTENEKQFYLYLNDGTNMVYDYHDNDENEVLESSNYGSYEEETWNEKAGSREAAAASVMNVTGGYSCAIYGSDQAHPLNPGSLPNTPASSNVALLVDGVHFNYIMLKEVAGRPFRIQINEAYPQYSRTIIESVKTGDSIADLGDTTIKFLKRSKTISEEQKNSAKLVSTEDSPNPVYMWKEDNGIYWYSDAKKVFVNKSANYMFAWLKGVTSLDLSDFDFSQAENLNFTFAGDTGFTSIDLSSMNTSNVRELVETFVCMTNLTSIDISMWNISKVTDVTWLFGDLENAVSIKYPSNLVNRKTTSIGGLFAETKKVKSLNLSGFVTDNVTNMRSVFDGCESLTSIDVSNWRTDNVTDMAYMFYKTSNIKSLDLSHFNTSKVEDFEGMFAYMTLITSWNLSNFNVSNANSLKAMFYDNPALKTVDLRGWSLKSGVNTEYMFTGDRQLTTIYVTESWKDKIGSSIYMFNVTQKIKGGNGTTYDGSYQDKTRAVIDGENGQKGYFTSNKPKAELK